VSVRRRPTPSGTDTSPPCGARSTHSERTASSSHTDFPYENGDAFIRAVDYINDPQIDTIAARAILDQNAGALLGIG
jgi:hypothetical protein